KSCAFNCVHSSFALSSRRLIGCEIKPNCHDEPRNGTDVKRRSPSIACSESSSDDVSERSAHRNRQIEQGQNPSSIRFGKHFGNVSRRDQGKRSLSYSYNRVSNQERGEAAVDRCK